MLKGFTIDQVKAFHKNNYSGGSGAALRGRCFRRGRDGSSDPQGVRRMGARGRRPTRPRFPLPATRRFALLDRADAPQSTVLLGLRVPSPSHKDWVALQVTDALLGGAFASRITSNIREQKGYTYSPFSTVEAHPGQAELGRDRRRHDESHRRVAQGDLLRDRAPAEGSAAADELRGIQNNLAGIFVVQNASRSGVIGRLAFVDLHGLGDDYLTRLRQARHGGDPGGRPPHRQRVFDP